MPTGARILKIDSASDARLTNLENNVYKITYYEIVSGTSGTITPPTGATFNANEFGDSGDSILSKINVDNKPTFSSPTTAGGVVVTANLNPLTGAWTTSGTYTDASVALIYSINISASDYSNLNNFYIIEETKLGFVLPSLTNGSVLFSNGTTISQDNANFFWDDTNNRLGIGTSSPTHKLTVTGSSGLEMLVKVFNTNGGFYLGSYGSNYGGVWSSNVTPSSSNYAMISDGADMAINASSSISLAIGNSTKAAVVSSSFMIGSYSNPVAKLQIGVAPTASANYGLVSLGSGAFDGTTSGYFSGSASGTVLAINEATGFVGNLVDFQVAGESKMKLGITTTTLQLGNRLWINYQDGQPAIWANPNTNFTIGIAGSYAGGGASDQIRFNGNQILLRPLNTANILCLTDAGVGIGLESTLSAKLHLRGIGATSATSSLYVDNSSNERILQIKNNRTVTIQGSPNTLASEGFALNVGGAISTSWPNDGADALAIYGLSNTLNLYINSGGKIGTNGRVAIGTTTFSSTSYLHIPVAPTASSNYGLFSIGDGPFDGSTAGFFSGSANGTLIAGNLASGSTSDLLNLQVGGGSKYKIDSDGNTTIKGSLTLNYVAVTTTYSILATDYTVNATSGTFTVTLPTAVGITGKVYNLHNSGSGIITIATTSSQTIDGNASGVLTLVQYDNLKVQSDGANWIIIS